MQCTAAPPAPTVQALQESSITKCDYLTLPGRLETAWLDISWLGPYVKIAEAVHASMINGVAAVHAMWYTI